MSFSKQTKPENPPVLCNPEDRDYQQCPYSSELISNLGHLEQCCFSPKYWEHLIECKRFVDQKQKDEVENQQLAEKGLCPGFIPKWSWK